MNMGLRKMRVFLDSLRNCQLPKNDRPAHLIVLDLTTRHIMIHGQQNIKKKRQDISPAVFNLLAPEFGI
jgi:hypothetical protein